MSDEQMDARLRTAGETWRASNDTIAAPPATTAPVETLIAPAARRTRRAGLFASAAVVVAALVVGGVFLLHGTGGKPTTNGPAYALTGTVWRLTGYGSDQPRTNSLSTLYISADGNLVADDGCTLIGAKIDAHDGRLAPTHVDLRYYGCTDSGGDVTFTRAIDILTSSPSYKINGDQLAIGAMHLTAARGLLAPTLDVPTFLGSTWVLTRVTDGQGTNHPVTGSPTLQATNGTLTLSDGCNGLSGDFAGDGQQLDLKGFTSTAIGCGGATAATAAAVDKVFAGSTIHQQVEGTRLIVKGDGVGALFYQWVPKDKTAVDAARLIGKTWRLVSVAGDAAVGDATLRIDKSGKLTGGDGCQDLGATVDVGSGTITTHGVPDGPAATCQGATKDQASTTDSFLQADAQWAIRDGKLLIYGGGAQAFALVYQSGPSGSPAPTAPTASPLVGPRWTLTGVETQTGAGASGSGTASSVSTEAILRFNGQGGYTVSERCGVETGEVAIRDTTVDFSNRHFVPHRCPARPDADAESLDLKTVDRVLDGTDSWTIREGQLRITKGNTTLTFDS